MANECKTLAAKLPTVRVLGIDPGSQCTGFGVLMPPGRD